MCKQKIIAKSRRFWGLAAKGFIRAGDLFKNESRQEKMLNLAIQQMVDVSREVRNKLQMNISLYINYE